MLVKNITSKFSNPKMSKMPIKWKSSGPFIRWLILAIIQWNNWEYNAMARESREPHAWKRNFVFTIAITPFVKYKTIVNQTLKPGSKNQNMMAIISCWWGRFELIGGSIRHIV